MSVGWKVTIYTTLILTIIGIIGNIGASDFLVVLIFGIAFVAICVKCLELARELEIQKAKEELKK
jgi:hypothetical protein